MGKKIIIIGGGMAGTSAAHTLVDRGYDVTIIEKENCLGGRIKSVQTEGISFECGAGFVTNMYTNLHTFLKEQELDTLLYKKPSKSAMVIKNTFWVISPATLLGRKMLSTRSKLEGLIFLFRSLFHWRVMDPLHIEKLSAYEAKELQEVYPNQSQQEFFINVLSPIIASTFYWSKEQIQRSSNAMLLFYSKAALLGGIKKMKGGLQQIPEAASAGSTVLLGHMVQSVHKNEDGYLVTVAANEGSTKTLSADGVICATTATVALKVLQGELAPYQKKFLEKIRYSSATYIANVYKNTETSQSVSTVFSTFDTNITSINSLSFQQESRTVTKLSVSGDTAKRLNVLAEEEIQKKLNAKLKEAEAILPINTSQPLSKYVWKWEEALPLLPKGYFLNLQLFKDEESLSETPLLLAGDYLGGPFIEGAFNSGKQVAERMDSLLS